VTAILLRRSSNGFETAVRRQRMRLHPLHADRRNFAKFVEKLIHPRIEMPAWIILRLPWQRTGMSIVA